MKILITGSNGLLGQKLVAFCITKNVQFVASSAGENRNPDCPSENYRKMDIANHDEVKQVITDVKPTHVIHTAAITNVDYCQLNPDDCARVNNIASQFLAEICRDHQIHFQFLSTDFVFDGEKGNYAESDVTNPVSIYGESKEKTEQFLINGANQDWSIVRTIIVYGTGNNLSRSNLILWAKESLEKGTSINIIDDQYRAPTFVDDLANACLEIVFRNKRGIYHIAGPETYSIYEIVARIADYFGYSKQCITQISSATLNQPAKRPPRTGFDLTKAKLDLNYTPRTLEQSLELIFN